MITNYLTFINENTGKLYSKNIYFNLKDVINEKWKDIDIISENGVYCIKFSTSEYRVSVYYKIDPKTNKEKLFIADVDVDTFWKKLVIEMKNYANYTNSVTFKHIPTIIKEELATELKTAEYGF
jgi:hypothetical protein